VFVGDLDVGWKGHCESLRRKLGSCRDTIYAGRARLDAGYRVRMSESGLSIEQEMVVMMIP
jgi:hypothetical protein